MNRRYNDKIEKYKNCDGILGTDQIIPIIIGYDGILYRQSAELLDKMFEEIAPATLYKAIYREIGYAWASAEDLSLKMQYHGLERKQLPL